MSGRRPRRQWLRQWVAAAAVAVAAAAAVALQRRPSLRTFRCVENCLYASNDRVVVAALVEKVRGGCLGRYGPTTLSFKRCHSLRERVRGFRGGRRHGRLRERQNPPLTAVAIVVTRQPIGSVEAVLGRHQVDRGDAVPNGHRQPAVPIAAAPRATGGIRASAANGTSTTDGAGTIGAPT